MEPQDRDSSAVPTKSQPVEKAAQSEDSKITTWSMFGTEIEIKQTDDGRVFVNGAEVLQLTRTSSLD